MLCLSGLPFEFQEIRVCGGSNRCGELWWLCIPGWLGIADRLRPSWVDGRSWLLWVVVFPFRLRLLIVEVVFPLEGWSKTPFCVHDGCGIILWDQKWKYLNTPINSENSIDLEKYWPVGSLLDLKSSFNPSEVSCGRGWNIQRMVQPRHARNCKIVSGLERMATAGSPSILERPF